jgi:hypothetical protein
MRYQRHDSFMDNGSIKSQVFRPSTRDCGKSLVQDGKTPGGGSFYTRTTRFLGISFRRSASEIPSHHLESVVGLSFQSLQEAIPKMPETKPQLGDGTGAVKEADEEDTSASYTSVVDLLDDVLRSFDEANPM